MDLDSVAIRIRFDSVQPSKLLIRFGSTRVVIRFSCDSIRFVVCMIRFGLIRIRFQRIRFTSDSFPYCIWQHFGNVDSIWSGVSGPRNCTNVARADAYQLNHLRTSCDDNQIGGAVVSAPPRNYRPTSTLQNDSFSESYLRDSAFFEVRQAWQLAVAVK